MNPIIPSSRAFAARRISQTAPAGALSFAGISLAPANDVFAPTPQVTTPPTNLPAVQSPALTFGNAATPVLYRINTQETAERVFQAALIDAFENGETLYIGRNPSLSEADRAKLIRADLLREDEVPRYFLQVPEQSDLVNPLHCSLTLLPDGRVRIIDYTLSQRRWRPAPEKQGTIVKLEDGRTLAINANPRRLGVYGFERIKADSALGSTIPFMDARHVCTADVMPKGTAIVIPLNKGSESEDDIALYFPSLGGILYPCLLQNKTLKDKTMSIYNFSPAHALISQPSPMFGKDNDVEEVSSTDNHTILRLTGDPERGFQQAITEAFARGDELHIGRMPYQPPHITSLVVPPEWRSVSRSHCVISPGPSGDDVFIRLLSKNEPLTIQHSDGSSIGMNTERVSTRLEPEGIASTRPVEGQYPEVKLTTDGRSLVIPTDNAHEDGEVAFRFPDGLTHSQQQ